MEFCFVFVVFFPAEAEPPIEEAHAQITSFAFDLWLTRIGQCKHKGNEPAPQVFTSSYLYYLIQFCCRL